jgi:hypothetical protein
VKVGRNEPCPCGSGLKYKNCHLESVGEVPPTERRWQRLHETCGRLSENLVRFVKSTYGLALFDEAWREFTLFEEEEGFDTDSIHLPVFIPWFYYQWRPEPLETPVPKDEIASFPVASAYLKRRGRYVAGLEWETPMQAVRTADGREMVEALLLDFERNNAVRPQLDPDILAELRATLLAASA